MNDRYFSRCATWSRLKERLVVHDSRSSQAPRMITMDPWPELIFSAADGVHTVGQLVGHLASQYPDGKPAGLDEQVHAIVNDLVAEGILRLHEGAEELPPYYAEEYFSAAPATRKAQMQADGLIPPDVSA